MWAQPLPGLIERKRLLIEVDLVESQVGPRGDLVADIEVCVLTEAEGGE